MPQQYKIGALHTVIGECDGYTFVQYHRTKVVKWNGREIVLDTGGWETPTTKVRMNQTANQFRLGFSVYQKKHQWFVSYKGEDIPFGEGNKVTLYRTYPRFETNCENCVFLGEFGKYDLYYCTGGKHLIAKYGNDVEDYKGVYVESERPDSLANLPEFIEAKRLAVEKGLIENWMPWSGGDRPVGFWRIVKVKLRNGFENEGGASNFVWIHTGDDADIIAYLDTGIDETLGG